MQGLSSPQSSSSGGQEWICPLLDTLSFDGCSAAPWDALRALVEARLPASASADARLLGPARSGTTFSSSASAYAASQRTSSSSSLAAMAANSRISRASSAAQPKEGGGIGRNEMEGPCRLRVIDLTRCPQISKEMVAWLRMYVAEVRVRRETEQTYWGEFGFDA